MPKPDPALLDPARYPYSCHIPPRFGDMDINMHINNVALAGMLEDGRVRFHRASGYRETLNGLSSMIVSLAIEYLGEAHYPDDVTIHSAIEAIGGSSHTMVQLAMQHGRIIAFSRSVLVAVGENGAVPVPASFVEGAADWTLKAMGSCEHDCV